MEPDVLTVVDASRVSPGLHGNFATADMSSWPAQAEFTRWDEFVLSYLPTPWPGLSDHIHDFLCS
jgi:hypothetical protein